MGKFSDMADLVVLDVSQLLNRSMRAAILTGLVTAVRSTTHDSSNAAAHWMVASDDGRKSRPWQRKTGKINDFRGTKGARGEEGARAPTAPVGYRRDGGKNRGRTVTFVRERELREVISKIISGRKPDGRFYFYHPLAAQDSSEVVEDLEKYKEAAGIEDAGNSAVEAASQAFARHFAAGNVRKAR